MDKANNYWFVLEPYVYSHIIEDQILLYNTLDRSVIETESHEVKIFLQELLKEENGGICILSNEQYNKKDINEFIYNVREKFMGDIINVNLSKRKPIQILPYVDFLNRKRLKDGFLRVDNILQLLFDVTFEIDQYTDINGLISFIKTLPNNIHLNFKIDSNKKPSIEDLFLYLNQIDSDKNILCKYKNIFTSNCIFPNNFHYKIFIDFPLDKYLWDQAINKLNQQRLPYRLIFEINETNNIEQSERLIQQYQINKYHFLPVYTKGNIDFFKENVFLTKNDILSTPITMKDTFKKQVLNINDFGKIIIQSNGDVYANKHHPVLGNIYKHSIYWLIQKEINEGLSWLRIRNQTPCNQCIYQWLCPSPSDYELEIGKSNLCNIQLKKQYIYYE